MAEDNNLGTEQPNGESVKQELDNLANAEEGLEILMRDNDVFHDNFERLQKEGMTNPQIFDWMIQQGGMTEEQLKPFADYINANARVQGMQQATQQKIEELVGRMVQDWSYRGTMNGQKTDGEQVVYVQDRDGRTLIVGSGDVAFDTTTGRAKEDVGDMLVCFDPNKKEMVYVKVDDVTFMQTQKPEYFGNEYRQRLEEINSQAYNEAMAEQAERNANKPQQEGTPDKSAGPETVPEETEPNKNNAELYKVADSLQGKIGQNLSKDEADGLVSEMEKRAEPARELELTPENWAAEFGDDGKVQTPLGEVKMGENQLAKLFMKGREADLGLIKPTLTNPDVIIEEKSKAEDGREERPSSYLFVKTFVRDGKKVKFYASVTVKKDGMEVVVSNHFMNKNAVDRKMQEGKMLFIKGVSTSNSSDRHLAEHLNGVPDLLPTQENDTPSVDKGTNNSSSGNGENVTLTFEDGSPVPMTTDSKGRNVADYSQMTPEHGAEWIRRTFGDNADKVVDGKIKKAEAALKDAEKIKIDYSADDADIIEAETKKKEAVDAAQRDIDFFTRVKNAMKKEENLGNAGGTGATGNRYEQWRNDGYHIGEGGVRYDRQKKEDQTGVYGKEVKVDFAPKVSVKGRAKVVEIDSVQASHRNGQANPWHFGPDWQPKDRTDEASLLGQNDALNNFDPEKITGDGNAYIESAPSVNERHEVIQGNNRAEILRKLYDGMPEEAAKYKQWLIDNAERFSLDAAEIAKMKRPVLVNELPVDDATAKELGQHDVKEFESGGKAIPRTSAVINMLGDKMQSVAGILMRQGALPDDAKMSDLIAQNADKVLDYLSKEGVMTATEEQTLRKDKTTLRLWMTDLLKNGLFEGDKLSEAAFSQLPDNAQKAVLATYLRDTKSPDGAKIKQNLLRSFDAYVAMMDFPGFANAKNLAEARAAVNMEIEKGNKSLFGEDPVRERYSTFELELAAMYKGLKDQKTLTGLLDKYFDAVQGDKATNRQLELGDTPREPISKEEAIKEVFNSYDTTPAETQRQVDEAVKTIATEITKQVGEDVVVTDEQEVQKAYDSADADAIKEQRSSRWAGGEVLGMDKLPKENRMNPNELWSEVSQYHGDYITQKLDEIPEDGTVTFFSAHNGNWYFYSVDKNHSISLFDAVEASRDNYELFKEKLKKYGFDGTTKAIRDGLQEAGYTGRTDSDKLESFIRQGAEGGNRLGNGNTQGGQGSDGRRVAKQTDRAGRESDSPIKEFRSKNGEVYGFTVDGKIYLDTKRMKPETPLHEYTHLWSEALKRVNPKEWENVKKLFDEVDGLKEEVQKLYPELKGEDLYDEMIAVYSGREGTKKLEDVVRKLAAEDGKSVTDSVKAQGFIGKVKEALQRYWKGVADMLHIHFTSAEDVADKVLADWAKGIDPREIESKETEHAKEPDFSDLPVFDGIGRGDIRILKEEGWHAYKLGETEANPLNLDREARRKEAYERFVARLTEATGDTMLRNIKPHLREYFDYFEKKADEVVANSPAKADKVDTDSQGNPLNEDGSLKVEKIASVDDLTDEDFSAPTRNVELPELPKNVNDAIGADGKPVVIKKNIFEKNWNAHKFPFGESRAILKAALYNTDLVGQTQPTKRPLHWVAIKIDDKSPLVVLEVNKNKDNVEIVGWYTLDGRNLERIKRQAEKNGGELVMLSPRDKVESLSTPLDSLSSKGKVNDNQPSEQGNEKKSGETSRIDWSTYDKAPKNETEWMDMMHYEYEGKPVPEAKDMRAMKRFVDNVLSGDRGIDETTNNRSSTTSHSVEIDASRLYQSEKAWFSPKKYDDFIAFYDEGEKAVYKLSARFDGRGQLQGVTLTKETFAKPKGKTPIDEAALAYHEEKVATARKAYEEAKASGDESETKRTRDEFKKALDDKLKAQGLGLIQRRKEIAKELGKKEAEKIDKPWKEMDSEERIIDTQAKMMKKARAAKTDINSIKDVREVKLNKNGILVTLKGDWTDYGINFSGSDNPQYWRENVYLL